MNLLVSLVGVAAAVLTSLSYIPQIRKAWPRGATGDLSLKMLIALTAGLTMWTCYGILQSDWAIIAANVVATALSGCVLGCKIRDLVNA